MQRKQNNLIQAMRLIRIFITTNAAVLGAAISAKALKTFDNALDALESHRTDQNEHGRNVTSAVSAKVSTTAHIVRAFMRPIAAVARLDLPDVPEFKSLTTVPLRGSLGTLIAAGYGMAASAKLYEARFIESGLDADFLAQLTQAVDTLQATDDSKGISRSLKVTATKGAKKAATKIRAAVNVLDAMITAKLADDDVLLDQWKNVRRVVNAATIAGDVQTPIAPKTLAAPTSPAALPATTSSTSSSNPATEAPDGPITA